MARLSMVVRRHPLVTFFVLAYALAWSFWIAYAAGVSPNPVFASGPFLAALIVTALTSGKPGVRSLLRRMAQWRAGLRWYAVALFLPLAVTVAATYLNVLLGAPAPSPEQLSRWPILFLLFPLALLNPLSGALGEEPGWRGYALQRLQAGLAPLAASVILGVVWAGWHLPLFITGIYSQPVPHVLGLIAASILLTWLYNNTDGSVWMAMLLHASTNTVPALFFPAFSGPDEIRLEWLFGATWCVTAILIVTLGGLSRKAAVQPELRAEPAAGV